MGQPFSGGHPLKPVATLRKPRQPLLCSSQGLSPPRAAYWLPGLALLLARLPGVGASGLGAPGCAECTGTSRLRRFPSSRLVLGPSGEATVSLPQEATSPGGLPSSPGVQSLAEQETWRLLPPGRPPQLGCCPGAVVLERTRWEIWPGPLRRPILPPLPPRPRLSGRENSPGLRLAEGHRAAVIHGEVCGAARGDSAAPGRSLPSTPHLGKCASSPGHGDAPLDPTDAQRPASWHSPPCLLPSQEGQRWGEDRERTSAAASRPWSPAGRDALGASLSPERSSRLGALLGR